jgi:hypothetical protein
VEAHGPAAYPQAKQLLITADAGGSNSYRARLWKCQLHKLADATGLSVTVCHFPPGTSKWNKIEHRMFCHYRQLAGSSPRNFRGDRQSDCQHPNQQGVDDRHGVREAEIDRMASAFEHDDLKQAVRGKRAL